jgi:hypothetical protein
MIPVLHPFVTCRLLRSGDGAGDGTSKTENARLYEHAERGKAIRSGRHRDVGKSSGRSWMLMGKLWGDPLWKALVCREKW